MDDRLEKALDHANYRNTLFQQRETLKMRFAKDSLYAVGGGLFTITPALISFVDTLIRNHVGAAVLIDDKGLPIKIDDLEVFRSEALAIYAEATNAFHADYETLRKARSVKAAVL